MFLPVVWWAGAITACAIEPDTNLLQILQVLTEKLDQPFSITYTPYTLRCVFTFTIAYVLGIGIYYSQKRNYRRGVEHGSAKWGDTASICKRYRDKRYTQNLILTQNFRMGLDCYKHKRNLNVLGMIYSNLFQTLYYVADRKYHGKLPIPVHCIMDEWPNVALPDDFDKLLATMRSRAISCSIIIQNIAQMKALFKDSWESLIGNCDEFLYLGGNEKEGHKYVSELLGKETLDTNTYGQTKGRSGSYSVNFQQSGRELLTPDEVRLLDNRKAVLLVRGERPILDEKYDLHKHVNVKYTEDGGAPPYDYAKAPLSHEDVTIDTRRLDDYELLSAEEILGGEQSF